MPVAPLNFVDDAMNAEVTTALERLHNVAQESAAVMGCEWSGCCHHGGQLLIGECSRRHRNLTYQPVGNGLAAPPRAGGPTQHLPLPARGATLLSPGLVHCRSWPSIRF